MRHPIVRSILRVAGPILALALAAGCSGDLSADPNEPPPGPRTGRGSRPDPNNSIFGPEGATLGRLFSGDLFGGRADEGGGTLPVNKYLWQGSLDTLSFLPLASTDPFTGVIATEWATTPDSPGQRFKVTVYLTSAELEASSLKVAVFREDIDASGAWIPRPVSIETVRALEDAILTRSRQIRIAEIEGARAS